MSEHQAEPQHRRFRRPGRRRAAVALVAGLVLGYTAFSLQTWAGFDERTAAWSEESQQLLDAASAGVERPVEERASDVQEIRRTVDQLSVDAEEMCTPRAVIRWQSSLGAGTTSQQSCQESVEQVTQVAEKLDRVAAYLEDEYTVAAALDPLSAWSDQATEDEFAEILQAWQDTEREIAELSVSEAFEPTRAELLAALDEVIVAWEAVDAAHEAQDLVAFAEARDELPPSYTGLAEVSEAGAERLAALDEAFIEAYRSAYANR